MRAALMVRDHCTRSSLTRRALQECVPDIDEIAFCTCKPPEDGGEGCGDKCINRASLVECSPQCSLGKLCSNKQLQRRSRSTVSKVLVQDAGERGLGLFADSKICQGELVGEYLGEVLTEAMYLERQRQFADEKHKYFMNLGGGEVIDASRKAGKCRFCNHSCEPNAETQKWLVNGSCSAFPLRTHAPTPL